MITKTKNDRNKILGAVDAKECMEIYHTPFTSFDSNRPGQGGIVEINIFKGIDPVFLN